MPVTFNILKRIVRVTTGFTVGTGTIVEIGGQEFLLSAAHVFDGVSVGSPIGLEGDDWKRVWPIKRKFTRGDIALISFENLFNRSSLEIRVTDEDMFLSMDVYIAGFPAGQGRYIDVGADKARINTLVPFLRKGIVSNIERNEFIIDTLVQKGFSGGPVFGLLADGKYTPWLIGVISSGLTFPDDQSVLDESKAVTIRSGFTSCIMIGLALELAEDELGIKRPSRN